MAEILVKAVDHFDPDPVSDAQGSLKSGDPVVVMEDGHAWGNGECAPVFIVIQVPGIPASAVAHLIEEWHFALDYNVILSDPVLDRYRIEVFCDPAHVKPDGTNAVTRAQVEPFLSGWNLTFVNAAANAIRFDLTVFGLLTSPRMFGVSSLTGVVFTENSYDQATGRHQIAMDWSARPFSQSDVIGRLKSIPHSTIVTDQVGLTQFLVSRSDAITVFKQHLSLSLNSTVRLRRWRFSGADVNAALATGGMLTIPSAQIQARVLDKVQL